MTATGAIRQIAFCLRCADLVVGMLRHYLSTNSCMAWSTTFKNMPMNNTQDVALHPMLPHPRPFSRLREKGEKPLARRRTLKGIKERGWGEGA